MDKEILDKLKKQAIRLDVVGYDYSSEPPTPIHNAVFDEEKFADLILAEAIYIGGGLVKDIEPQHKGIITVHEVGAWQRQMKEHFNLTE